VKSAVKEKIFLFCRPLRSTGTDNCGQDHIVFAGSDLLPARPQPLVRPRLMYACCLFRAEDLIDGIVVRLSKAYPSAYVCACLWLTIKLFLSYRPLRSTGTDNCRQLQTMILLPPDVPTLEASGMASLEIGEFVSIPRESAALIMSLSAYVCACLWLNKLSSFLPLAHSPVGTGSFEIAEVTEKGMSSG
jgi:hypothetical protein